MADSGPQPPFIPPPVGSRKNGRFATEGAPYLAAARAIYGQVSRRLIMQAGLGVVITVIQPWLCLMAGQRLPLR